MVGTIAAVPVLFFLLVVNSLVLAVAATCVELGLFTASRLALSRPRKPVGAERFVPPAQRR
jgi:ABC-type maltose transport system permease subunit